jgi:hypothetical protein
MHCVDYVSQVSTSISGPVHATLHMILLNVVIYHGPTLFNFYKK